MADEKAPNEATTHTDLYQRHGDADPSNWDEQTAVTARPNDTPLRGVDKPAVPNSSFADRAKARAAGSKAVDSADAENKAVKPAQRARKGR